MRHYWLRDSVQSALPKTQAPKALIIALFGLFLAFGTQASEVYFSPTGGVRDQIIKRINHSKSTIDIAMYSFTAGELAQTLADAHQRGVAIRVVRDASQSSNNNDESAFLEKNGIEVHTIAGRGRGIMHDKFAIFDGKEVFTGSYNWTNNAEHFNWENAVFLDDPKLIAGFQKEYEVLWKATPRPVIHKPQRRKLRSKALY